MKKILSILMITSCVFVFGMTSNVNALTINLDTSAVAYGNDTSVPDIEAAIASIIGSAVELYKATPGTPVTEDGALSGSYTTVFSGDLESAIVTYSGGYYISGHVYLLAKDGKANDDLDYTYAWYLYDLTALGWDGTEEIDISGLWPEQGSFSHLAIYGSTTAVPEPSILILLGTGLLGIVGIKRRK